MGFFRRFRVVRDTKEKCIYVKKGFRHYATYSGGAWFLSDKEILEDFVKSEA